MQSYTLIKSDVKIESIKLYSITGKLVKEVSDINANEYRLQKGNIKAGSYFIKINKATHIKLIIE